MSDELIKKAMQKAVEDMSKFAKSAKAAKFQKKKAPIVLDEMKVEGKVPAPSDNDGDEVKVSPVEGGLNLGGVMSKPGNSGKDIADMSDISPEELERILAGAK